MSPSSYIRGDSTRVFVCLFLQNDMTSVGLHWEELLMPLLQKYKLNITWGDQDLLNIIFHHNPGKSELMDEHFNIFQELHFHVSRSLLVSRVLAGVSVPVELSARPLHLRQQLCVGRRGRRLHPAREPGGLPRRQTARLQGRLPGHTTGV